MVTNIFSDFEMVHSTSDIISCFEAEQRNTVFSALSEYLSTGQYVDISLVCKGQVLRAHKVVLSSSSKYFKDFFRHQPGVNIIDLDKELAPNDLSLTLEDVQLIIGILYCVGTVEISPARIETLLICAQVLGIPTLISFLKKIRESINVNDNSKMIKDPQPRLEYTERPGTLPGALPMLSPHHNILAPAASARPYPVAGPSVNIPGPSVSVPQLTQRRNSAGELVYLLPGPGSSHQFPQQTPAMFPSSSRLQAPASVSSFSTIPMSRATFTRADTPSPSSRSPLLDLSVVKPMTASCVNSPVPPEMAGEAPVTQSSPVPGPSGVQQRSSRSSRPRSVSSRDQRPGPHVQDSLLSANMTKTDPETVYRRESSRISTASYSSFTLNYLQSPRLKSTENAAAGGDTLPSCDGFDQNFFISLNTLQANQIDDLENVLLPHLGMDGRTEGALFDDVACTDADHDISTTSPEAPSNDISLHDSQEQPDADNQEEGSDREDNSGEVTASVALNTSADDASQKELEEQNQNQQPSSPQNSNAQDVAEPINFSVQNDDISLHDEPSKKQTEQRPATSECQATSHSEVTPLPNQPQLGTSPASDNSSQEQMKDQHDTHNSPVPTFKPRSSPQTISEPPSLTSPSNPPASKRICLSRIDPVGPAVSMSPVSHNQIPLPSPRPPENLTHSSPRSHGNLALSSPRPPASPVSQDHISLSSPGPQESLSMTSPIHYTKSVTPVPIRLTPSTSSRDVVTPVRLTPQGGIALTPIKNLMPEVNSPSPSGDKSRHDESVDEPDGSLPGTSKDSPSDHSGEIVMNLDKVIEGQRMKFSIPGISQAVTVNFSPEALQEMKNAALSNQASLSPGASDTDNQYAEITSSEKIKEADLNNLTNKGEIQYSLTTLLSSQFSQLL